MMYPKITRKAQGITSESAKIPINLHFRRKKKRKTAGSFNHTRIVKFSETAFRFNPKPKHVNN